MSMENKLELLWNSANTLNNNSQTHRLLKSYYINTCRKLAKNLQTPKEKFANSQMCPHCGCFWKDGEFGLKLVPKEFNNNSKTKKLIENLKQDNDSTGKVLTKSQRNRAKWLKKKISNHLAINCYQCKHRTLLKMENPKLKSLKPLLNEKSTSEMEAPMFDSKNLTKKTKKLKNKNSKQVQGNISKSMSTKSQKERNEKSVKISNKKNAKVDTSTKVVSKTQKQNSLLQLAALLQKQSKNDTTNSAQKRLQSFFKINLNFVNKIVITYFFFILFTI